MMLDADEECRDSHSAKMFTDPKLWVEQLGLQFLKNKKDARRKRLQVTHLS